MKNSGFWQVAEIEISYKSTVPPSESPVIDNSAKTADLLRANWPDDIELRETFVLVFVNKSNRVKGFHVLSRGGTSATIVDLKLLFGAALKCAASAIILAHNHPSGSLKPSTQDIDTTSRLVKAGALLDLPVLDHIILTPRDGYYSFCDEGLI